MFYTFDKTLSAFGTLVERTYKRHGLSQKTFRRLCGIGTPQLRGLLKVNH